MVSLDLDVLYLQSCELQNKSSLVTEPTKLRYERTGSVEVIGPG